MKIVKFILAALLLCSSADARGLHGGQASGVSTNLVPTGYVAIGDSVTEGYYATSHTVDAFVALLGTGWGVTPVNKGYGGTQACDNTFSTAGAFASLAGQDDTPSLTSGKIYTIMLGTNDAQFKDPAIYGTTYALCHSASISWMATPATTKVKAQNCTKGGTWTNDTAPTTTYGVTSTTNGSTLTCSITTAGKALYVWYKAVDSGGGAFTYAIDGGSAVSLNSTTPVPMATYWGTTSGMVLERITGLSAGAHSIVFTVTSATSGSNPVEIWAIGSPPSGAYNDKMRTLVGGVLKQLNDANPTYTAGFNTSDQSVVTTLLSDGLPISFADVRAYVNATTDMNDQLHPNNSGHLHLKQAFDAAAP